jgi:hypothetical protein
MSVNCPQSVLRVSLKCPHGHLADSASIYKRLTHFVPKCRLRQGHRQGKGNDTMAERVTLSSEKQSRGAYAEKGVAR